VGTIAQRALEMVVTAGIALAVSGPALAQGTPQTDRTRQPTYACTINVPQDADDASLARRAKITLAQATRAAQTAVSGTALRAGLDNENGCLVYSVEIHSADGKIHDVKIDAGTAAVLHQEAGSHPGTDREGPGEGENGAED
jgi:hypothetical protein